MARNPRASRLETRTARLKLPVRWKPYDFTTISPGIALGYRRNKAAGVWVVRVADGRGGNWTKRVALADDHEDADGEDVLTWFGAIDKARQLARGQTDERSRPAMWSSALDDYEADLRARDAHPGNASVVRHHLAGTALLNKPVALLTAAELKRWRNDLLARGIKPATVVRVLKSARASLNYAADHDPARIPNRNAWRVGLSGLTDTYAPVNRVLADADVLRLVEAAYVLDPSYGLFLDVLASTGTRTSQACGLLIADLQADGSAPRLMMPSSRKGKGTRRIERRPVPIPRSLASKLQQAAGDRGPGEPLLTRADGTPWAPKRQELQKLFAAVAARTGIGGTAYQLRHSSIVRSLLAGTPVRVVAGAHGTSTIILEKIYSRFIMDHADGVARRGLLDTGSPASTNVVPLPGRRS
jgi:integrase